MTKKTLLILGVGIFLAFALEKPYKDGTYKGLSRAMYTQEPYYAHTQIKVENGRIVSVYFMVRDSAKHEYFDDQYERYFAGNDEYVQQCRNDRKGMKSYPDSLLKYQDINKLDAISGATWSFNLFKASVKEALAGAGGKE